MVAPGMVVTEGDPANPTTPLTKQQREAAFTSSYDEEKAAMRMALDWLLPSHAVIYDPVTPPPQGLRQPARHASRPQMF